jgi:YfiH family protein
VRYFCTTRAGGIGLAPYDTFNLSGLVGDQAEILQANRQRLLAVLPAEPLWLHHVHGMDVIDADQPLVQVPQADASVTTRSERVLAVMVADCLPVVMADRDGRVLGVAHAGWRGLCAGVLENTLAHMRAKLPTARAWQAWIGPSIGPNAFEVGPQVKEAFWADGLAAQSLFLAHPDRPNKWLVDLPGLARLRLLRMGVEQIAASARCTVREGEHFFSYRREGQTGRMALLAWLHTA